MKEPLYCGSLMRSKTLVPLTVTFVKWMFEMLNRGLVMSACASSAPSPPMMRFGTPYGRSHPNGSLDKSKRKSGRSAYDLVQCHAGKVVYVLCRSMTTFSK